MTVPWRQMQLQLDAAIDDQWGERVLLIPLKTSAYGAENDLSRKPVETVGVLTMNGDRSFPLLGDHSGAPFIGRGAVEDIFITIQDDKLNGLDIHVGDHIKFLDRDNWIAEINRIVPGSTYRTKYILIDNQQ